MLMEREYEKKLALLSRAADDFLKSTNNGFVSVSTDSKLNDVYVAAMQLCEAIDEYRKA